jgi:hypothetical protein
LIPQPTIPKLFDQIEHDDTTIQQNVDIFGKPFTDSSSYLPQTPGLLHAATELTAIASEVYAYNALGDDQKDEKNDITTRMKFYEKLKEFKEQLPDKFQLGHNFTPQTCWLRCVNPCSAWLNLKSF